MVDKNDWRRFFQEESLMKCELLKVTKFKPYSEVWDHEHCTFCWDKFSLAEGCLHEGYCTADEEHTYWICPTCFNDFNEEFQWVVIEQ